MRVFILGLEKQKATGGKKMDRNPSQCMVKWTFSSRQEKGNHPSKNLAIFLHTLSLICVSFCRSGSEELCLVAFAAT